MCSRTEKVKIKNKQDVLYVFFPNGALIICYQCFSVLAFFYLKTSTVCVCSEKAAHNLAVQVQRQ